MADGGMGAPGAVRLETCGGRLRARCACGREGAIDPRPWLAQGLGSLPLQGFEARLRCACGARWAALAADPGGAVPHGAIWVFR